MKRLVPKILIISSQILLGALFLIISINNKSEVNFKVNSKEMNKLSWVVYNSGDVIIQEESNSDDKLIESNELDEVKEVVKEEVIVEEKVVEVKEDKFFMNKEVINTYTGTLTGYGPDCYGCGNRVTNKVSTASGYHIANIVDGKIEPAFTIMYNDSEYGDVRILAGDSSLPYKTIVRVMVPNEEPIIGIVLDRGSTVGFENCRSKNGCLTTFDLLYETEGSARGKQYNVTFDILRIGG